jgi:hypothetical protein
MHDRSLIIIPPKTTNMLAPWTKPFSKEKKTCPNPGIGPHLTTALLTFCPAHRVRLVTEVTLFLVTGQQ